ncbi:transcription factor TCP14 [Iris pallida]|uniref:Transcription factor TCP14 n=1 Tax=Iris pallida TaxID=29817 RepID=A0AAX6GU38_IRIPA|nr:transcription factor TCP14 [Iris pallida]
MVMTTHAVPSHLLLLLLLVLLLLLLLMMKKILLPPTLPEASGCVGVRHFQAQRPSGAEAEELRSGGLARERGVEVAGAGGEGGAGAAERYVEGGEVGRDGAGAGGGDDGGLRLLEEPLDGLPVGLVAELPGELEDAGGAEGRHAYAPPAALDLGVPVLGGAPLGRGLLRGVGGGGGGGEAVLGLGLLL